MNRKEAGKDKGRTFKTGRVAIKTLKMRDSEAGKVRGGSADKSIQQGFAGSSSFQPG